MADVFVSYKREDAAKVRKLVAALRGAGLDVWWDEDIPASAPWEATIERALAAARAVIVCWSPASVASENVRSEARVAREDGRLIQVFVRPCEPPLFFGERQGVDLSNWRGKAADPRIATLVESVRTATGFQHPKAVDRQPRRRSLDLRIPVSVVALVLILGSIAGWWLLAPAKAAGPQTLAVLPFRALNPADANLVDAIWDDTRGAISRNPNLRVLGRETVDALANKHLDPAEYRRKTGADYLLDGSVEHVGDQVQMKLSLTRTKDGAEVWSDELGGRLDDVFAFQQRIANEVEGRIRGRVAPGGGTSAKNIATSGEVYALYADARAKLRARGVDDIHQAGQLLRQALAIDPNYAPAWADLAVATFWGRSHQTADEASATAVPIARRALQLAPNLGHAHATLALVQMLSPETEPEIRKAVELDPGDAEAWMWLGTVLQAQNRTKEALVAHGKAVELEPLFPQATGNKVADLVYLNDGAGLAAELKRIRRTGDDVLFNRAQRVIAEARGRPGDEVRIMLQLRAQHPEIAGNMDLLVGPVLLQLGFVDEALAAHDAPPEVGRAYRGIADSPQVIRSHYPRLIELWQDDDQPALLGRLLPKHGRLAEYVGYYRSAFATTDDFFAAYANMQNKMTEIAPTIAEALREGGDVDDANAILRHSEAMLLGWLHNGPARPDLLWRLAFYRAAEGRDQEAVELLNRAVAGGMLPDRQFYAIDLADEPCFARLVQRNDFRAIRGRILARIEEERRKVPQALLAQAYPVHPMKAAA